MIKLDAIPISICCAFDSEFILFICSRLSNIPAIHNNITIPCSSFFSTCCFISSSIFWLYSSGKSCLMLPKRASCLIFWYKTPNSFTLSIWPISLYNFNAISKKLIAAIKRVSLASAYSFSYNSALRLIRWVNSFPYFLQSFMFSSIM